MSTNTKVKTQGIRMEKTGGPEVMQFTELELSEPSEGQALVKLHAAGVNCIDIYQRTGKYPVSLPYTPGLEGAGVVEKLGPGISHLKIGDRVAYTGIPGSYAQANIVPADRLVKMPDEISFEQGASFPLQGMTAHYLIYDYHQIKNGDNVLIHAAAGGMGLLLVQWAKHLGARVIGTVSTDEKARLAKEAGADEVIIYSREDFVAATKSLTGDKGADYIIDGVGKDTFTKNLDAVKVNGHITLFGSASGPADPLLPNSLQAKSITVSGGSLFSKIKSCEELARRAADVLKGVSEGWLRLRIEHTLPLSEAAKAHELLENRKTTGKLVLRCLN
jgi:NADPH2:quinone reductase